jgi:hypothetical protein
MSTPRWTEAIRNGDFQAAEDDISLAVGQRLLPRLQQAAETAQVMEEVNRANAEAGPYHRYVQVSVLGKLNNDVVSGKIQTPSQFANAYKQLVNEEVQTFRNEVRPGYMRSESEPYLPADKEVRDYIADRRATQLHLKEEGRRISNTPIR